MSLNRALAVLAVSWALGPRVAMAQALTPDDSHQQVWFVPRLAGSLAIDASLLQSFALGRSTNSHPTTSAGVSIGWRHFFDGHGRRSLRAFVSYDRGGVFDGGIEGSSNRIGGGLALTARGISESWVFGTLSWYADASALIVDPVDRPLLGVSDEPEAGFQVGSGLEATFGSLIVIDPYLFAETGASLGLSHVSLPSGDAWELWGRWLVRFDWAARD